MEQIKESKKAAAFLEDAVGKSEKCMECKYLFLCHGGCKRHWYGSENYFCSSYQSFFEAALLQMKEIATRLLAYR